MNRQFLFIKSATESIALPVDSFSHAEYTSDTTVSVYFNATRSGKDASVKVVLTVSSGKANDVVTSIINQVASGSVPVMKFDDVKDSFYTKNVTGITSITVTDDPVTAQVGPQGPAGADGAEDKVILEIRTDEAVSKGDPLYITGYSTGQSRITVAKADASDSAKMPSIGLAGDDYAINTDGDCISMGSFVDVDTSSFSVGDVLYVAATGGLTATKPTGTNLIQNVGKVGRSNANNGEIVVMAIGRSNDVPNIPDGQIWIGNASGVATPTAFGVDLDSTPQLGGDLDVNGNKITSASNGDITIDPDGTGAIILKSDDIQFDGGGVFQGKIKLYESDVTGSNFVALQAPLSLAADTTYTLPASPSSGNVLQTDGVGTLSWVERLTKSNATHEGTFNLKPLSGGSDALLAFYDDAGDNYIILRAPDVLTGNTTFVLPASDGSANQVLKTDGAGQLSFVDQTSGTVDTSGTPANTQVSVFEDSDTIKGYSNLTFDGDILTVTGQREFAFPSAAGQFYGDIVSFGSGPSGVDGDIVQGKLYYLSSSQTWEEVDANSVSSSKGMLGIAIADDTPKFLVKGFARNVSYSGHTSGDILYVSTTAGGVTPTAPSGSGDVVRVVGYSAEGGSRIIYFDPSKDWIELTA